MLIGTSTPCGGLSVDDGAKFRVLAPLVLEIAETHRQGTAKQARTVLSRLVLDPLVDLEAIPSNPLAGRRIRLEGEHRGNGGARNVSTALTVAQYWSVVRYLLARGDEAPTGHEGSKRRARHSAASAVKWQNARDLILLRAWTGLRVAEASTLRWADVRDDGEDMVVLVRASASKTGTAREVGVMSHVAAHLRAVRSPDRNGPHAQVSPPVTPWRVWSQRARDRATAALYEA